MKGKAMNAKRYNRYLTIEQLSPTLKVVMFWHEGDSEYMGDRVHFKEMEFFPLNMESACNALEVFFMYAPVFFPVDRNVYIKSPFCDVLSYYFDGVADSENPEQMFISKYILEDARQHAEGYKVSRNFMLPFGQEE